jgi:hypothetical protein
MKLDIHPPPTVKTICFSSRGDISRWFCPGRQYYVVVGPTTDAKVNMTFSPNHTCLIFYPRTAESSWEWRCQVCDLTPYPPPPVGLEKHDPFAKPSVHVHGVRQSNPHQEVRPGSGEARVNSRGVLSSIVSKGLLFLWQFFAFQVHIWWKSMEYSSFSTSMCGCIYTKQSLCSFAHASRYNSTLKYLSNRSYVS